MAGPSASNGEAASLYVTATDGLKLHVRSYGSEHGDRLPVVCLPGLTRTAVDFDVLATALAGDPERPRRVFACDYRGRGLSDYDRNPDNYSLPTELSDLLAVLIALSISRAVFIGTSRGGLLNMLLGAARPTVLAGVVLNDIGPVIEPTGLLRIKSYVGKMPRPQSYEEGAEILRRLFSGQFPKLKDADWLAYSRRSFKQGDASMVPTYDVRIAKTLDKIDFQRPLPPLWPEFDALARIPLMVIRGGNSDLLTEQTVTAMAARRPSMDILNVPDQGHAPMLTEPDVIHRIADFIGSCETAAAG